jgi:hypothetical protein
MMLSRRIKSDDARDAEGAAARSAADRIDHGDQRHDRCGTGYTGTPAVAINDPTGTGATATAVVSGNAVTSINVTAKGQGYTNPAVVISGGGGSGATATAKIGSDDALQGLITRASAVICDATNRPVIFDSGVNITEKRNGNGQQQMLVRVDPIISVSSLTIDGATVPASDGQSNGYLFDETQNLFDRLRLHEMGSERRSDLSRRDRRELEAAAAARGRVPRHVRCGGSGARTSTRSRRRMSNNAGTLTFTTKDLPAEAWTIINQIKRVAPLA